MNYKIIKSIDVKAIDPKAWGYKQYYFLYGCVTSQIKIALCDRKDGNI